MRGFLRNWRCGSGNEETKNGHRGPIRGGGYKIWGRGGLGVPASEAQIEIGCGKIPGREVETVRSSKGGGAHQPGRLPGLGGKKEGIRTASNSGGNSRGREE